MGKRSIQTELPLEFAVKRVSPEFYKVIQPNVLVAASNSEFKIAEHRLYTEILAQNHQRDPEQLFYTFPYAVINPSAKRASKNAWRNAEPIIDRLQSVTMNLPKEYVEKVYGKKIKRVKFNPFNKVIYESGCFTIRLDDDFKKILVISKDHFTRGELELLQKIKSEWTHKIYWQIRQLQPWKGTLEFKLQDLKEALGVGDKYVKRYDNFKERVLLVAREELKYTWAEFEIEEIRGGKGGREVLKIRFKFRSDIRQKLRLEKDLRHNYEVLLSENGITIDAIHEVRRKIYYNEFIKEDRDVRWDYFFVEQTIEIVKNKKSVKNPINYLYKVLFNGDCLNEVEKRRAYFKPDPDGQLNAFGEKIAEGNKIYSVPFERFQSDAEEMGLTVEQLCKQARYKIIDSNEGKVAVKTDCFGTFS